MDATEPGRLLAGRYRLTAVIGSGGMGVVWQGHDELLGRDVAVKEIIWPPHLTEQEQQVACRRATREAQMAGRLSHRNVVRVYDIVEDDGHPCIVMEYVPYQSLRDLIENEGPLPPDRAAEIGLGILAALCAAHAEGILHRDVKPANILVGPDGRMVLTDFGIARAADSPTLTGDGALLGSPSYIAPERARGGQANAGAPADLWGLGASLYTAVEGHPPFERNGALATLTAVVADEPDRAPHAGPLAPVISGLLKKDPDQRLGAAEAERLLREVAEPSPREPLAPEPPQPLAAREPLPGGSAAADLESWQPAAPSSHGSRRLMVALVVLVMAAAAVTGLAFALTSSPRQPASGTGGAPHPAASPGAASSGAATSHPASRGPSPAATPSARTPQAQASALPAGVLPVHELHRLLDRRSRRLAHLAPGALRLRHRPVGRQHLPAHRPVRPPEAECARRLGAAAGQPGEQLPGLPPHQPAVGELPAGRAGRGLGVHLRQERRAPARPQPEHPGERQPRLRALLVHAGQRLERRLPLLPGIRRHVPPRAFQRRQRQEARGVGLTAPFSPVPCAYPPRCVGAACDP